MKNTDVKERKIIQIGERSVIISSKWEMEKRVEGPLLSLSLRSKAAKSGLHYAVTHAVSSKKGKQDSTQYSLLSESEANAKLELLAGEPIIAENVKKWVPEDKQDAHSVFIYSIGNDPGLNAFDSKYWILAIDPSGRIESESQFIVDDRYALKEALDIYSITTESFNVIHVQNDNFINDFLNDNLGTFTSTFTIPLKDFVGAFNNSDDKIKRIYKPSPFKAKKVAIVSGAIAASAIAWMGYSYISQSESFDFFESQERVEELDSRNKELRELASSLKTSNSSWSNDSFREETLNQFIDGLKYNLYEPFEIALIIQEINNTLPVHAMEWELIKLSYENNMFFARYERIKNAQGVYYILDEYIESLNKSEKSLSITPFNLLDDGETRIYAITPFKELDRKRKITEMDEKLRKENSLESKVRRDVKSVSNKIGSLTNLYDQFNNMTFTEKWITRKSLDLLDEANNQNASLSTSLRRLNKSRRELSEFEKLEVPRELVLGQVMDFITMLQIDSFFKWSLPQLKRGYPDVKTLKERAPKKRKAKKSKNKTSNSSNGANIYKQAIESYDVEISTRDSEEEGKVQSYGISDMIQLGYLINKPFVNVDLVDYTKFDEQWKFKIHFHRQTPEYTKRILNKDNKEVK